MSGLTLLQIGAQMEKKRRFKLLILIIFTTCGGIVFSFENDAESKSRSEIVNRLQKWPQDFNAKNIQEVCGLFASDLIASYPGTKDRNYEDMCRHLTGVLTDANKTFRYEAPKIEQILINDDLAVVRLVWTLKVSDKNRADTELIQEHGLDVFKRQKDGSWKIAISYAYPEIE